MNVTRKHQYLQTTVAKRPFKCRLLNICKSIYLKRKQANLLNTITSGMDFLVLSWFRALSSYIMYVRCLGEHWISGFTKHSHCTEQTQFYKNTSLGAIKKPKRQWEKPDVDASYKDFVVSSMYTKLLSYCYSYNARETNPRFAINTPMRQYLPISHTQSESVDHFRGHTLKKH